MAHYDPNANTDEDTDDERTAVPLNTEEKLSELTIQLTTLKTTMQNLLTQENNQFELNAMLASFEHYRRELTLITQDNNINDENKNKANNLLAELENMNNRIAQSLSSGGRSKRSRRRRRRRSRRSRRRTRKTNKSRKVRR